MNLNRVPKEPPWFQSWALAAITGNGLMRDLYSLHMFTEAVITDEESYNANIWQGDMPVRAAESVLRVIEAVRPIPVTERLPEQNIYVLAYSPLCGLGWTIGALHGSGWFDPGCERADPEIFPTHWLPLPPQPE